jgi:tight adherence protein C
MLPELTLTLLAVFLFVAVVTGSIAALVLGRMSPEHRRLQAVMQPSPSGLVLPGVGLTEADDPVLKRFSVLVPASPRDMTRLRLRLARAGYHSATAPVVYSVAEKGTPIVLAATALLLLAAPLAWIVAAFAAVIGYMLPGLLLERQIARRRKQIQNGLPDALDLLIVCLEAGSALDQAIVKATDELDIAYPALAYELRLMTTEMRAGKPRMEAFRNLSERTGVDDVRALVAMLAQTDRFGTSVSQALRTHADVSRSKRRQRAEERAQKVGVKLVFPLVLLLFPAFYVVVLGPAIIQFARVFFGQVVQ